VNALQPLTVYDDATETVRVCFPEARVGIVFEDFHSGGEYAHLAAHYLTPQGVVDGYIHGGEVKLDGVQSRNGHVKALDTRADAIGYDWSRIIELACREARSAWRLGTPGQWLDMDLPDVPVTFTIDRLLLQDKVTIWYGAGGIGKGYTLTLAAVCISHGLPFLGLPVARGRVMYLDWEDEASDMRRRIREVSTGLGVTPAPVLYARQHRPLRHIVRGVIEQVRAEGITTVMIDSATGAGGEISGDTGYEAIAQQLMRSAARIPATVLMNDHTSSEGRSGKDLAGKPYGSVRKYDLARATWELRGEVAEEGGATRLGMFHTKHNHTAKFAPFGVEFLHDRTGAVRFKRFDIRESATLGRASSSLARASFELRQGALELGDLAARLEMTPNATYLLLNRNPDQFICLTDHPASKQAEWGLVS
jgi:hypothetical protein